jgi:hypothetical protein
MLLAPPRICFFIAYLLREETLGVHDEGGLREEEMELAVPWLVRRSS